MPTFRVVLVKTGEVAGDFDVSGPDEALETLAHANGFGDFDELATAMKLPADRARSAFRVRELVGVAKPAFPMKKRARDRR